MSVSIDELLKLASKITRIKTHPLDGATLIYSEVDKCRIGEIAKLGLCELKEDKYIPKNLVIVYNDKTEEKLVGWFDFNKNIFVKNIGGFAFDLKMQPKIQVSDLELDKWRSRVTHSPSFGSVKTQ